MGTFLGHFVPGLTLSILGLWHTINTIRSYYLKGPSNFTSKFSHPLNNSVLKLRHLDLILILSFSLFAIIFQVFDYPHFRFSFKLDNFEHATMLLHLAIFASFSYFAELSHVTDSVSSIIRIMVASVFGQELFLLHFHSTDHVGLEGHYHRLMKLIVLVSFLAAVAITVCPNSFPVAVLLSISVVFQGCWSINMGFMLWVPKFVPKGCFSQMGQDNSSEMVRGAVIFGSSQAEYRARALANMQFSWVLAGIFVINGFKKGVPRVRQLTAYEQLQSSRSDSFKPPIDL